MDALTRTVIVVGGGLSGIQASLDLASMGFTVHLIEESPSLGGRIDQLRGTPASVASPFCTPLYPKMVECASHPQIELHTYSKVTDVRGSLGNLKVKVLESPRYVKEDKCIGCRACADKCPVKVPDGSDAGKSARKAIYMPFVGSIPRIVTIDAKNCLFFTKNICRVCERFCTSHAIDFEQKPNELELKAGAIIVAPCSDLSEVSLIPSENTEGVFCCGYRVICGSNDYEAAVKQATAIAAKSAKALSAVVTTGEIEERVLPVVKGMVAEVDPRKCNACGACETVCASEAPKVTSSSGQKKSQINPLRCEACGTCIPACPRSAITLRSFADEEILNKIRSVLSDGNAGSVEPRILMFACKYCGFPVFERTGAWKTDYPENVKVVSLPCSGRLDPFMVVAALKLGADGVIISGCRPGYCHFLTGNMVAEERYAALQAAMDSLEVDSSRVRLQWISPSEARPFVNFVKEMSAKLSRLGQSPMKHTRGEPHIGSPQQDKD